MNKKLIAVVTTAIILSLLIAFTIYAMQDVDVTTRGDWQFVDGVDINSNMSYPYIGVELFNLLDYINSNPEDGWVRCIEIYNVWSEDSDQCVLLDSEYVAIFYESNKNDYHALTENDCFAHILNGKRYDVLREERGFFHIAMYQRDIQRKIIPRYQTWSCPL